MCVIVGFLWGGEGDEFEEKVRESEVEIGSKSKMKSIRWEVGRRGATEENSERRRERVGAEEKDGEREEGE